MLGKSRTSKLSMPRIPYIAGYSTDGHTVFIDRHLPRSFHWLMKTVRVEPFLLTHEIDERGGRERAGRLQHTASSGVRSRK